MREPDEMAWYEVEGGDGCPRVSHGIKRLMPEGCKEISFNEAQRISGEVRAREPKPVTAMTPSGVPVDLKPLQDQIDAIAQAVIGHAKTLDKHSEKIEDTLTSVADYMQGVKSGRPE
jgi:hypothetical protein